MAEDTAKTTGKTTEKTPRKRTGGTAKKSSSSSGGTGSNSSRSSRPSRKPTASQVAETAAEQLRELTGKEAEGVTGLERTDDGWLVQVEVLELRRVPATTDVLASYRVEVDEQGELLGYRRQHRYARGAAGEER